MPPKKNVKSSSKKKNNQKSLQKSAAAVYCCACQKRLSQESTWPCVCTTVNFCNAACQQVGIATGKHECPGPPPSQSSMRPGQGGPSPLDDPNVRSAWQREHHETIQKHITTLMLTQREIPSDVGAAFFARLADKYKSAPCAYMAGIQYKNRLLGNVRQDGQGGLLSDNSNQGVLETDELAFKYLLQASQAGIGIAMQSLAELYIEGRGVRERRISGNDWLWKAVLLPSAGAKEMMESKFLMTIELNSMLGMLQEAEYKLYPGRVCSQSGPHLSSLLASLMIGFSNNLTLPPFAAVEPTLTVGNKPRRGKTGPVPIIGSQYLQEIGVLTNQLAQRCNRVDWVHGRRGVGKAATAQTYGSADARIADSHLYQVPPEPQCDDEYNRTEFLGALKEARFPVNCVHSEEIGNNPLFTCDQCLQRAEERLQAVARGAVAISLHETLPARGRKAIWKDKDENIQSDTFKVYCRGEVEVALAALVKSKPALAHPLFVAQDPNFLWPLIENHGTIRAALEFVAPHEDWNKRLGPIKHVLERQCLVPDARPGTILATCCNSLCDKMERYKKHEILSGCGGCDTRLYCSMECAKADWIFHKLECSSGAPKVKSPVLDENSDIVGVVLPPQKNEHVMLHGLKARPELNGKLGVVTGGLNADERYPVRLGATTVIAVKPSNLLQLGVTVSARAGKPTKCKCSSHGDEFCSRCSLDLTALNHLFKLRHLGHDLDRDKIEEIAELSLAKIEAPEGRCDFDPDFPIECAGLKDNDKRFLLKHLLIHAKDPESHENALPTTLVAALNGLCCYSASQQAVAKPNAIDWLSKTCSH